MSYLKIRNLEKSYGQNKILKGVSVELAKGEFLSLLGPSGSGKTTILRCIAGLEMPDPSSGEIMLGDKKLSTSGQFVPPEKRHLGMVFQNYAVWPHMNVFENVAFPLKLNRPFTKTEVAEKTREAIELVRLTGLENRFAHELSGGQQQRVALARALVMSPDALLLDEPLSNLDAILREELGGEIRRLQKRLNLTTILVTHDQKEALSLSDKVVVLNQGHIEAEGAPEVLYRNPPTAFVAEFLSGAQLLKLRSGETRHFLPRRWQIRSSGGASFKISSRIFLGNEYEYWGENADYQEPVRFFSSSRYEISEVVSLSYDY